MSNEIAGPMMLSIRWKEDSLHVRFYVASTVNPEHRHLLAEVKREILDADPELYEELQRAFYEHVKRLTASYGVDMTKAEMRVYPGGLHDKGKPS